MTEKGVFWIALVALLLLSPQLSTCRSLPRLETSAPEPEEEASNSAYSVLDANLFFEDQTPSVGEGGMEATVDSSGGGCERGERWGIFEPWMERRKKRENEGEGPTNSTAVGNKTAGELIMENNEGEVPTCSKVL